MDEYIGPSLGPMDSQNKITSACFSHHLRHNEWFRECLTF